jgi:hypothetical protein
MGLSPHKEQPGLTHAPIAHSYSPAPAAGLVGRGHFPVESQKDKAELAGCPPLHSLKRERQIMKHLLQECLELSGAAIILVVSPDSNSGFGSRGESLRQNDSKLCDASSSLKR